jgi:hypothetical protein
MKPVERFGVLSLAGLVLAALGILAPILWDRYRSRTALELQILSTATVVERGQGIEKLRIMYDTASVPAVSRIDFALINTGSTAITKPQVVEAPTLILKSGRMLEVQIVRSDPAGVRASLSLDPSGERLSMSFPLLNGGDALFFSILASTDQPSLTVSGRIAGVRQLALRDRRQQTVTRPVRKLTVSFYIVSAVTAFVLVILLVGIYIAGGEKALKAAAKSGVIVLPRGLSSDSLRDVVIKAFAEFAGPETRPTINLLAAERTAEAPLSDDRTEEIESTLRLAVLGMTTGPRAIVALAVLAGIGLWFVLGRLL